MRKALGIFSLSLGLGLAVGVAQGSAETKAPKELTVALLGDTEAGKAFGSVLKLAASEGAQVIMINGDFGYGSSPTTWKKRVMESIDIDQHKVIGSLGNHDAADKNEYVSAFKSFRTSTNGLGKACTGASTITRGQDGILVDEVCQFGNVSIIASSMGQLFDKSYFEDRLAGKLAAAPAEGWKLVGYHFTLESMNPGVKRTESTAKFFDLIRQYGAIGAQAHTHTAMASCPISSPFTSGSATPQCHPAFGEDLDARFVAPGTGMYMDSSLGGKDVRYRDRCSTPSSADCKHLVDLITEEGYTKIDGTTKGSLPEAGAMFIVFNHGGNAKKAHVYFKAIDGKTVFSFEITRQ